ncbi:MAG: hypothetical protein SFU83_00820 [Meiothermus sp.]|nr:hypothetical protein [Meiothermus sp.]
MSRNGTSSLWLERQIERIRLTSGLVVLQGGVEWGAPHLIGALSLEGQPLVWLELKARDAGDPVVLGNKLTEALTRALGSTLVPHGLPYTHTLSVLRTHLGLLGPMSFALGGAEHGLELARALIGLTGAGNRVFLHFNTVPADFGYPPGTLVLGPDELSLSLPEALDLSVREGTQLSLEALTDLWLQSEQTYEHFRVLLAQSRGALLTVRPSPAGPQAVAWHGAEFSADGLFETLRQNCRYIEALEVAIAQLPGSVEAVLPQAAQAIWRRGTYDLLLHTLERLPRPLGGGEVALRWRLAAALELGREAEVLPEAQALLARAEAPELRALYSQILYHNADLEGSLREAERALRAERTPQTLLAYGDALRFSDLGASLEHLKEALRLGEEADDPHVVAASALAVARTLAAQCEFQGAVDWADLGLEAHQRQGLGSSRLRLYLINERSLARVVLGQTGGLEDELRSELERLEGGPLHTLLSSTLADVLLTQGRHAEAAALHRRLWDQAHKRSQYGLIANLWMRALLEHEDSEAALHLASRAVNRTSDLPPVVRNRAQLAQGMALALHSPAEAQKVLRGLLEAENEATPLLRRTQAALYLALAHLREGQAPQAEAVLQPYVPVMERLGRSGLRYLAGPESAFDPLWQLLESPASAALRLNFLGGAEVHFEGRALGLRQRHADLLLALALHPEGLSGDTLTLLVYGESGSSATTKADLSRLRELIPISSRPYRLEVAAQADFLELPQHLSEGRLAEAVSLYQGQLLPNSTAPLVIQEREVLEEAIRRATLDAGDPEALLTLAERLKNDLELWEAALEALPPADPRRLMAELRTNKLREEWEG